MTTVYVPGCGGTGIAMPMFCVWFGRSGGSGNGLGDFVTSALCPLCSSQISPTAPAPLDVHARVPMLVIGTVTRVSVDTSTAIGVFETWYRAFAAGCRF